MQHSHLYHLNYMLTISFPISSAGEDGKNDPAYQGIIKVGTRPIRRANFFFTTAPLPCPYLANKIERRLVTELIGRNGNVLHNRLSLAGYRRSHTIAYTPVCPDCDACIAVRVLADKFMPSRSQRRVWKLNAAISYEEKFAEATKEQFALFSAYLSSRHGDGDMAEMDFYDYQALIEDSSVETSIIEFREDKTLVAACIVDRLANGLSAVYSFFDPHLNKRSLGTYMILWLLQRADELALDYLYLGFFITDCNKMSYKATFKPMEGFTANGWLPLSEIA